MLFGCGWFLPHAVQLLFRLTCRRSAKTSFPRRPCSVRFRSRTLLAAVNGSNGAACLCSRYVVCLSPSCPAYYCMIDFHFLRCTSPPPPFFFALLSIRHADGHHIIELVRHIRRHRVLPHDGGRWHLLPLGGSPQMEPAPRTPTLYILRHVFRVCDRQVCPCLT